MRSQLTRTGRGTHRGPLIVFTVDFRLSGSSALGRVEKHRGDEASQPHPSTFTQDTEIVEGLSASGIRGPGHVRSGSLPKPTIMRQE
jgi:hypothetical protein